eukprot:TRINITY_DN6808_c0_g1_i2.p1 TRINITY_DN6808_c0_g1~~TRINITY_DN6808_c0_g1_i2.p1  ORF type:complete len:342 (+),score=34.00 TRINITY_DN6808_c0_g1_i2:38-1063(+)
MRGVRQAALILMVIISGQLLLALFGSGAARELGAVTRRLGNAESALRQMQHRIGQLEAQLQLKKPGRVQLTVQDESFAAQREQQPGVTLPLGPPWRVDNRTGSVYLAGSTGPVFRLEHGRARLPAGVQSVQLHVGPTLRAVDVSPFLDEAGAFVIAITPRLQGTLPLSKAWHLSAEVAAVPGVRTQGNRRVPAIRLEQVLRILPETIPLGLVRLSGGDSDHTTLLSSGAAWSRIRHVAMELQDLPQDHTLKSNRDRANTTTAISVLAQKGYRLLCCACRDFARRSVRCFFERTAGAGGQKGPSKWRTSWMASTALEREACVPPPAVFASNRNAWSTPMCHT